MPSINISVYIPDSLYGKYAENKDKINDTTRKKFLEELNKLK